MVGRSWRLGPGRGGTRGPPESAPALGGGSTRRHPGSEPAPVPGRRPRSHPFACLPETPGRGLAEGLEKAAGGPGRMVGGLEMTSEELERTSRELERTSRKLKRTSEELERTLEGPGCRPCGGSRWWPSLDWPSLQGRGLEQRPRRSSG